MATTHLVVLGLSATVLTLVVALFFGFKLAGLGAAVILISDFLILPVFVVLIIFGYLGTSATVSGL